MTTRKLVKFKVLLILGLLLSACGPSAAELTPTVNPDAVRTEAVSTFAFGLTQTALAQPTNTPTLTPSPTATIATAATLAASTSTTAQAGTGTSCYNLTFAADVTIPDNTQMTAGQSFTKTWRVQNNGSCAWAPGFRFSLVAGDAMSGQTLTLSQPVAAGATTELSIPMTVPGGKTGTIRGDWRMADDKGVFFGEQVYVQIVVGDAAPTASTPAASTSTATMTPTEE